MKRPENNYMTTQAKQKYTAEFKENAVKRANESSNVAETMRELGGIKERIRCITGFSTRKMGNRRMGRT
jgi:hypothetical protein